MGYDLHITRAETWLDASDAPISEAEWMSLVDSDPDLAVSREDWVERRLSDGSIERVHPVLWKGCALWLLDGEVVTKNPDDSLIAKLVEIAERLGARVLGDEDEEYPLGD